jgi:hypothetical protein
MISLIIKHSMSEINNAGVKAIGYPGLWATDFDEVKKIKHYLENRKI